MNKVIRVLWQSDNGKWTLSEKERDNGTRYFQIDDGWLSDYPIMCDDGHVAYDYPERLPLYVRNAVRTQLIRVRSEKETEKLKAKARELYL